MGTHGEGGEAIWALGDDPVPPPEEWMVAGSVKLPRELDDEVQDAMTLYANRDLAYSPDCRPLIKQGLKEHMTLAGQAAADMCRRLGYPRDGVIVSAALNYDLGKDRECWQRYARAEWGAEPLARNTRFLSPDILGGYRHELGSVLELSVNGRESLDFSLAQHLIATHHGRGRPNFGGDSHDRERCTTADNEREIALQARRFHLLQLHLVHWGLAWTESILRCADIAAIPDRGRT